MLAGRKRRSEYHEQLTIKKPRSSNTPFIDDDGYSEPSGPAPSCSVFDKIITKFSSFFRRKFGRSHQTVTSSTVTSSPAISISSEEGSVDQSSSFEKVIMSKSYTISDDEEDENPLNMSSLSSKRKSGSTSSRPIALEHSTYLKMPHSFEPRRYNGSRGRFFTLSPSSVVPPSPHPPLTLSGSDPIVRLKQKHQSLPQRKLKGIHRQPSLESKVLERVVNEKEDIVIRDLIRSCSQMELITHGTPPDSIGSLATSPQGSQHPISRFGTKSQEHTRNEFSYSNSSSSACGVSLFSSLLPQRSTPAVNKPKRSFRSTSNSMESRRILNDLPLIHSDASITTFPPPPQPQFHTVHHSRSDVSLPSVSAKLEEVSSVVTTPRSLISPTNLKDAFETDNWRKEFSSSMSKFADRKSRIESLEKYLRMFELERMEAEDKRNKKQVERVKNLVITPWSYSLKEEEEEEFELLLELPEHLSALVNSVWGHGPTGEVFTERKNIRITRGDLLTLKGLEWLNDEVINFYLTLVVDTVNDSGSSKVHLFNTFFYPKIMSAGYSGVRRWTKKVDIFSFELILLPVHLGMHWCLAAIDFRSKRICYYDSLKGSNTKCLEALRDYLVSEARDKKQMEYDISDWQLECRKDIPEQHNGSDCGVFTCMYARHLARNKPLNFTQADLPAVRRMMVAEIVSKELLLNSSY